MEKGADRPIDADSDTRDRAGAATGDHVLEWLVSEEATAVARRGLMRCGFDAQPALVDDVLSDARVALLKRMRSIPPLAPDNPAAYGSVVVRNVANRLSRGDVVHIDDLDDFDLGDFEAPGAVPADDSSADEVRLLLEQRQVPPWLTSAGLAYLCFLMEPEAVPARAPSPRAGAREDQALVWPALWFAGERDLFPDHDEDSSGDPRRRTRARRIKQVLDHMADVFSRYRLAGEHTDA